MTTHGYLKAYRRFLVAWLGSASFFTGCCTYQGKFVTRADAEWMQALGVNVHCLGEAQIVNGQYREPWFPAAGPCRRYGRHTRRHR